MVVLFNMKGKFSLIPTPLGEDALHTIPPYVVEIIHGLDTFVVERAKTARHFIKATLPPYPLSSVTVFEIDETTQKADFKEVAKILNAGKSIGILSEAGCPGVADPGALVVEWAHKNDFEVVPLVGPSSILLALMGSGFNGQSFQFHGYLSAKRGEIGKDLQRLEGITQRIRQAQIFIETPYRNMALIEAALANLQPHTRFCIAADLTTTPQYIVTKTIAEWKKTTIPDFHKRPAIFLLG
jgi:16S rRNA (cytidine1402-2'-O)-methyltransferase